ncbi:MAG TPA: hypothetical protein VJV74_13500 [Terriglobia bacterium]|nr:hypothetical protein [Terriglobia bacterium]
MSMNAGVAMDRLNDEIHDEILRGVILSVLIKRQLDWMTFNGLKVQVQRGQGCPLDDAELRFHLAYLSDSARGYVELKPLRAGHTGAESSLVRATAKAVDLHDGRIAPDPGVAF